MQPLSAPAAHLRAPRRDPAPSRTAYKLNRLFLTPLFRVFFRFGLPALFLAAVAGWYLSSSQNREALVQSASDLRQSIEQRPEFMVKLMAIEGASAELDEAIREILQIDFPISSFDLDLEYMQDEIASLDVVKRVDLRIRPGGVLEVDLEEREPAVIWRTNLGLELLDETGHRVASLTARAGRGDLPVIAGTGAPDRMGEALALLSAAQPVAKRLRGLVRVGERRWDLVLDRDQRILLPEQNPVSALEQVLALDQAQDLLARDIAIIDMRNPLRPTLRLAPAGGLSMQEIRGNDSGAVNP